MTEPAKPVPPAQPSRRASWLDRRAKIALALAAVEGLLLLLGRVSKCAVLVVAIPCVLVYLLRGREMKPGLWRDALWVVAFSQLLIIVAAVVSFLIGTLVLILLGVFLAIALLLLWYDEPSKRSN